MLISHGSWEAATTDNSSARSNEGGELGRDSGYPAAQAKPDWIFADSRIGAFWPAKHPLLDVNDDHHRHAARTAA